MPLHFNEILNMMDMLKLLIIRAGALGDTLMLMPLINAFPDDQITILGRKPGIDFLEPFITHCIDIERGGWHSLFSPGSDIDVSCPQADHVIAFINDRDKIVLENLTRLFPDSKINIFPPFPDPDSNTHIAVHMIQSLKSAGIPVNPQAAFDAAFNHPGMGSKRAAGKNIVLHPGSGSKKKNYPPGFWLELLARIRQISAPSKKIILLTGPAEEDVLPLLEKKAGEYNAEMAVCPPGEELISLLENAFLYIGHDSGVTHLAAMLGINTIALFKNSSVSQWRPLGPLVKIIHHEESEHRVLKMVLSLIISVQRSC